MDKQRFPFNQILFSAVSCFALVGSCLGQDLQTAHKVVNRSISKGADPTSIHLNELDGAGIAWINGREFTLGAIELDIKGKDLFQGSFIGIAFHGQNDSTYESVYFRPFNFRSKDPVRKGHAVQYIANPQYDWPRLRDEYPGKYEHSVSPAPDPNQWFHVKINIENKKISVFVNGNTSPVLVVEPLVPVRGKRIGYWVGNGSGGDWKNVKLIPR